MSSQGRLSHSQSLEPWAPGPAQPLSDYFILGKSFPSTLDFVHSICSNQGVGPEELCVSFQREFSQIPRLWGPREGHSVLPAAVFPPLTAAQGPSPAGPSRNKGGNQLLLLDCSSATEF